MSKFINLKEQVKQHYSARAGLVGVGLAVKGRRLFEPIHQQVKIKQKKDTLDACSAQNVQEMQVALTEIYQCYSRGYRHNYQWYWQVLEVDLTGQACGKKVALASKGYFANQRNRRGRQVGYAPWLAIRKWWSNNSMTAKSSCRRPCRSWCNWPVSVWAWIRPSAKRPSCGLMPGAGVWLTSIGCWLRATIFTARTIGDLGSKS